MSTDAETPVARLYADLLDRWNRRDAAGMAALYAPKGGQVGFDGSIVNGRDEIAAHLAPIFRDHPTPRFVGKVREVRNIGSGAALLRAVAGMIPAGKDDINPAVNAIQTLVASRSGDGTWRIEMFQNTPAQFHGRPAEQEKLTAELRQLAKAERGKGKR
jgi:uncharacterized protein (TIGR02246 family)